MFLVSRGPLRRSMFLVSHGPLRRSMAFATSISITSISRVWCKPSGNLAIIGRVAGVISDWPATTMAERLVTYERLIGGAISDDGANVTHKRSQCSSLYATVQSSAWLPVPRLPDF